MILYKVTLLHGKVARRISRAHPGRYMLAHLIEGLAVWEPEWQERVVVEANK